MNIRCPDMNVARLKSGQRIVYKQLAFNMPMTGIILAEPLFNKLPADVQELFDHHSA